jgi:hypothetical protein
MKSVRFTLPLSPSVNECYSNVIKQRRDGRSYTKRVASETLEQFKKDAPLLLYSQGLIRGSWEGAKAVGYELHIYTRTHSSDASNRLKTYEDVVTQYLGFDDKHVMEGQFKKSIDAKNPRIEGHWFTIE